MKAILTRLLSCRSKTHEAEYWAPLLSHSPMEPMNAVVRIDGEEADVWTGIQFPSAVPGLVSRVADIPAENVRFHQTYLGGGFGRRGSPSHIIEATEIAKVSGKPIQLVWTREDDIQQGPFRPASLMRIKAGVDHDGNLIAWDAARAGADISPDTFRSLLPALYSWMGDGMIEGVANLSEWYFEKFATDESSTEGLFEDYDHPNTRVTHMTVDHELPMTFWRSVGHSYTAFAKESMIDEMAEAAGMDEVAFRLQNTQNAPRLNNVIRVAGEHMAKMNPPAGHHLGFAAHHSFYTDVAEIAEVSVENGKIRVHKVTCVLDCGQAVNPDIVRSQIEGGVIYGLTATLYGGLNLEAGAIKESNFHDYPMLRMNESPEIEVVIIDSGTKPTGVGEPGLAAHCACGGQCRVQSHGAAPALTAVAAGLTLRQTSDLTISRCPHHCAPEPPSQRFILQMLASHRQQATRQVAKRATHNASRYTASPITSPIVRVS